MNTLAQYVNIAKHCSNLPTNNSMKPIEQFMT